LLTPVSLAASSPLTLAGVQEAGDRRSHTSQDPSINVVINTEGETMRLMDWSGNWKARGLTDK
jgi:hypothetical protein